uniref:Uncharacterized protein n=1 Tax=Panagrolaimus sp. JU765 TaxID=591449 RepID=A0AC34R8Z6_9BILA
MKFLILLVCVLAVGYGLEYEDVDLEAPKPTQGLVWKLSNQIEEHLRLPKMTTAAPSVKEPTFEQSLCFMKGLTAFDPETVKMIFNANHNDWIERATPEKMLSVACTLVNITETCEYPGLIEDNAELKLFKTFLCHGSDATAKSFACMFKNFSCEEVRRGDLVKQFKTCDAPRNVRRYYWETYHAECGLKFL